MISSVVESVVFLLHCQGVFKQNKEGCGISCKEGEEKGQLLKEEV